MVIECWDAFDSGQEIERYLQWIDNQELNYDDQPIENSDSEGAHIVEFTTKSLHLSVVQSLKMHDDICVWRKSLWFDFIKNLKVP